MNRRVVGLFSLPWREGFIISSPPRNPLTMYHWAVWYKANPRSEDYMQQLFAEHYPGGAYINIDQESKWQKAVLKADEVILLYPDAIGLGFARVEREVKRLLQPWAGLRALNGRRRSFRVNAITLLGLRLRRFLERSMLGEVLATLAFLLVTPLLAVKDWARGRN